MTMLISGSNSVIWSSAVQYYQSLYCTCQVRRRIVCPFIRQYPITVQYYCHFTSRSSTSTDGCFAAAGYNTNVYHTCVKSFKTNGPVLIQYLSEDWMISLFVPMDGSHHFMGFFLRLVTFRNWRIQRSKNKPVSIVCQFLFLDRQCVDAHVRFLLAETKAQGIFCNINV